jgi:hypothetical protein
MKMATKWADENGRKTSEARIHTYICTARYFIQYNEEQLLRREGDI